MASAAYGDYLYGLRDIKITNMAGTLQEDLDAAQTLNFTPTWTEAVQRGDDVEKSGIGFISGGTANLTAGRMSSAAVAIMFGKSLTVSGSSPNEITTLQVNTGDTVPYFKVYGLVYDDDGGDMHIILGKCKVTGGAALEFSDGNYFNQSFDLRVFDDGTNGIWKQVQHETRTTLPTS